MRSYIVQIDEMLNNITGLELEEVRKLDESIRLYGTALPLDLPRKLVDIITAFRRMNQSQIMVLIDCLYIELREGKPCEEYDHLCISIRNHILSCMPEWDC